jgi:rod shape-determining protein MreD
VGAGAIANLYLTIPFLALIALVEATVLPHVRIGGVQPDLTLLVVGAWSLRRGVEEGAVWAFAGGAVLNLLSAGPFPATMFALLLVSLILGIDPATGMGRRQARPFAGNPFAFIVAIVFGTLVYHLVLLLALQLAGRPFDWLFAASNVILPRVLANLVLMPVVYRLLVWLDRRTRSEELAL